MIKRLTLSLLLIGWLSMTSFLLTSCRQQKEDDVIIGDVANNAVKILVNTDGFYHVSLADLQNAGLAVESLSTDNLQLNVADTAVPYAIKENQLIFYGQAPSSRYIADQPYILRTGTAGAAMAETAVSPAANPTLTAVPQHLHLEENLLYNAQAHRDDQVTDLWFWHEIGQQQKVDLSLNLVALESNASATLRLQLWGVTQNVEVADDHDFDLIVNGQTIATVRWDGETHFTSETTLPAGVLKTGNNTITLDNQVEGASFLDIMQINWLELEYMAPPLAVNDRLLIQGAAGDVNISGFGGSPLLFDLTDTAVPQLLTGWECNNNQACLTINAEQHIAAIGPSGFRKPTRITPLRQSDWHNSANQADLIIITTDALAPGLTPLIEARTAQGLQVALIPVAEIYDEFGYGADSPESIHTFVQYAVANWQAPSPRYLLLVGDATTDYRNYLGIAPANIVPPLMVAVEYSGETVSDARLVDVDDDTKPDLAIGRWPVDTLADVESLVTRTLAYETGTAVNQALFAADGTEAQFADTAARLYEETNMSADNVTVLDGPTADEVLERWNAGAWLTTYVGHGSIRRWGKDDVLNLEAIDDLKITSPSIVLQLTCLSGLFAHPEESSLTEEMMRAKEGPVLHVAATSLTLSFNQELFAQNLLRNLQDSEFERIGDAFQTAKVDLDVTNNSGLREISDTFTLFGDPSTPIVRPNS